MVLKSNDCDITESSNRFRFVMKDKGIGQKRVRIIATIYRMSDNDILATEKFYLCYERKSLPNHIVTSAPCYLYTAANSNSSNILYPTILPVDINVYRRGVKNTIQINNTRETILYSPKVEVSNTVMIKACYECGTTFIWNEERVSIFKREETIINKIIIPEYLHLENTTAIDYFQSKQFCKFINTLLFLPIVLLSANKEEKQVIVSILYGCMNNTILPTIKKIAESNMNLNYKSWILM